MRSLPAKWREVGFYEAFERLKLKSFEIPTKDYQVSGRYPIIDQGDGVIAGYIDREGPISAIPFIVFGDHTTIVKYVDQPCFIGSQGVVPLKARESYDPYFLYLLLGRTRIPALGYSRHFRELENKTFLLPPLAEQCKIAEILRTWDEAIETAEAELKVKQERKRGLMQKLLSPLADGSAKDNDWEKIKLGELGKFYSGLSGKSAADFGSGSPFISYNSVFGKSRCYIEGQPLVRVEQGERQNNVTLGDIILTGSSETADEVAMSSLYCDQAPAYLNSFCIGYSYDKKRLIPDYAEHYFRGQAFRRSVFPLAQGSTRFNISKDGLAKVEIRIPPISEQRKISEILLSADGDIELISNRIETLRTQKRGLMQKLLTGEVRVTA
jgi:restriction endonuclease S subunit